MDQFQDIRPYHDEEVRPVIDRLLANPEFISSLAGFGAPRLSRWLPGLARWLTRRKLGAQLAGVNDVKRMQSVIALYMDQMIEKTTSQLTHSGIEHLSKEKAYLFLCNHRDIAMDPAFVNYMLYHAGFDTVYIAIGDNLLKRPFVTDLMRLNKSFIVKRSLKGRDLLKSSMQLSEYMHYLVENHHNVWIAQREGRAKDGVDCTETAILKMLSMARRGDGFAAALNALHIVPVSVSYEFDPCDALKADELYQKATHGRYQKDERSDIHSIVTGMVGFKGHVHVAFGEQLVLESDDADEAVSRVDRQVVDNYRLQDTNYLAVHLLRETEPESVPEAAMSLLPALADIPLTTRDTFEARLQAVDANIRPFILRMYANPVLSRVQNL
ncbi:MAG: 1-acyl-sn-glycerol-3-phosphate acyltransferase [Gammaproteobacteria bacterium]|nr:1-acyl-sn-glycerol-3-phosphate acyltransferase [Pseudomonadales bacterium]MCP5358257.1 1-acyl-sn-glycerol-3-phosphate acyltransferase [Pseudomonadales bacterium]